MKKIIIWVLLCSPQFLFSQDPYSTTTVAEDFISLHIHAVDFNGKQYVIAEELCNTFFDPGCTIISEVLPNGALTKAGEIENFHIVSNAVTFNSNTLTLIGNTHRDTITIVRLDTALNEIDRKSYYQEKHIWTFGIIEFGPYFVVSTRDLQGAEDYFQSYLYWISTSDLAIIEVMDDEAFRDITMAEMKIDADTLLNIFSMKEDSVFILQYDKFRNLADVLQQPPHGFIQNANFEILTNRNIVYGLEANSLLNCINPFGGFEWSVDLAPYFDVPELQVIQEIVEAGNGDILVCGTMWQDRRAFIARLSNAGVVLWGRTYQVEEGKESFLFDLTETIDSNILFAGSYKEVEPSETSAHDYYWMLLTDADGCIDTSCIQVIDFDEDGYPSDVDCDDFDPNINPGQEEIPGNGIDEDCDGFDGSTHLDETSVIQYDIFPNPTERYINVKPGDTHPNSQFEIIDPVGKPVLTGALSSKIDLAPLSPGLYFLHIRDELSKAFFTSTILKVE